MPSQFIKFLLQLDNRLFEIQVMFHTEKNLICPHFKRANAGSEVFLSRRSRNSYKGNAWLAICGIVALRGQAGQTRSLKVQDTPRRRIPEDRSYLAGG